MRTDHFTQNHTQWNLPENAKARFGKGRIQEITYSADGNLLAVASSIGIWLYDTDTDEESNLLTESEHTVSISFSPDGSILASGPYYDDTSRLGHVKIWDVKTRKHIKTLTYPKNEVKDLSFSSKTTFSLRMGPLPKSSLSFSGNGLTLADGDGKLICLWNMETGKHINTLTGHTDSIRSITFSPNSGILASGGEDNTLRLWNIKTGKCLKILTGNTAWTRHTDWVSSVSFCGNSRVLASGSYDNTLRLWDVKTGEQINTLTGHTAPVTDILFIKNDHLLVSASYDGTVRLWDVKTGKHINTLTGHTGLVLSVSYSKNKDVLASANAEEVRLWNVKTGKHIKTFTGHNSNVQSLSFNNSDHILASASSTAVQLWDVKIGKHIKTLAEPINYPRIAFSNNSSILAITGRDESEELSLWLWNVETGKFIKTFTRDINAVESLSFSVDDCVLASASATEVQLWNVKTGKFIKTFTEPRDYLGIFSKDVSFNNDGSILAAGGKGNEVWLWDVKTGKHIKTLKHEGWVSNISFNRDGSILSSIARREVWLWDVKTGKHIKSFTHTDYVDRGWFSNDSRTLATTTGYDRRIVQLWDVKTGKHIKSLTGHVGEIKDVVFNSDGRTLATGSQDGTVLLWDVDLLKNENILAEENTEFLNLESRIQQICEDRGITTLVHFTRIGYLRNILHEGLLDHQSLLEKQGQQFSPNDKQRIDGHKEAICLSISFPNRQLFQKFSWSDNDGQPDYSGWVVLVLDAKVLWELDCAFCQENAASNAVRHILIEERKNPEALENMFTEVCRDTKENVYERQSLQIPDNYPTHPQAEVLVFDRISSDYIKEVHFYDESPLKQWCDNNPWINPERLLHNQQYFGDRRDQIVWEDDNLDDDDIPFGSRINDDDDIPF